MNDPALMFPKLIAESGPLSGQSFSLADGETCIGRLPENHVAIHEPAVSRRHCRITRTGERYQVTNLSDGNHTYVNDQSVSEHWLAHGDCIRVGATMLRFVTSEAAPWPVVEPTPEPTLDGELEDPNYLPTLVLHATENAYLHPVAEQIHADLGRRYQLLMKYCQELHAPLPASELAHQLLERLSAILPAQRGAVLFFEDAQEAPSASFPWKRGTEQAAAFKVSRTIVQTLRETGKTQLFQLSVTPLVSLAHKQVQAAVGVPLSLSGQTFGALYLDTPDAAAQFAKEQLEFIEALATLLAGTFYRAYQQTRLDAALAEKNERYVFVGVSQPMLEVRALLGKYAMNDSPVLITGESGTGKEVIARTLHRLSRRGGEFTAVNCAAIPHDLLENELFGHEKGAFTGAIGRFKGRFEQAGSGTLFLDEIGDMPTALQAKLLRVVQERVFTRLGSEESVTLKARIVAATNQDLKAAIAAKRFREDLFYRLNVLPIELPPLRKRPLDIRVLAEHFLAQQQQQRRTHVAGFTSAALACLAAYAWPGNVRELENVLERALLLCETELLNREDLPTDIAQQPIPAEAPPESIPRITAEIVAVAPPLTSLESFDLTNGYQDALRQGRIQIIRQAMRQALGSYQLAAETLGLHTSNLHRMIRELGLKDEMRAMQKS